MPWLEVVPWARRIRGQGQRMRGVVAASRCRFVEGGPPGRRSSRSSGGSPSIAGVAALGSWDRCPDKAVGSRVGWVEEGLGVVPSRLFPSSGADREHGGDGRCSSWFSELVGNRLKDWRGLTRRRKRLKRRSRR